MCFPEAQFVPERLYYIATKGKLLLSNVEKNLSQLDVKKFFCVAEVLHF
jgi:hypothetical protein